MSRTGVSPALLRMDELLAVWQPAGDGRCAFLECYAVMTRSMRGAVTDGVFLDPPWVDELLEQFAVAYFDAVASYEQAATAPRPWMVAFEAAAEPGRPVLQHLLLGINAHINYDLVVVLVDLLGPTWATAGHDERAHRWHDYDEVNRVIARTVDQVQEAVVADRSPALGLVDALLGPIDEWLAGRFLNRWRDHVWADACGVLATGDPIERARRLADVERRAERRAYRLLLRASRS
jgi:hypothetical protein